MTNIVTAQKLRAKGAFFDDQKMRLHARGHTLGWVRHLHLHDVLEYNPSDQRPVDQSAFSTSEIPSKSATASQWHHLLAHPSNDVIQHLQSAAEGVNVTGGTVPKTHECETCALSTMHRIVSHSHDQEENSANKGLFFRISYDLIAMNTGLAGQKWVSHFACMTHDFNIVYTHRGKGEASYIVRQAINLIKT